MAKQVANGWLSIGQDWTLLVRQSVDACNKTCVLFDAMVLACLPCCILTLPCMLHTFIVLHNEARGTEPHGAFGLMYANLHTGHQQGAEHPHCILWRPFRGPDPEHGPGS